MQRTRALTAVAVTVLFLLASAVGGKAAERILLSGARGAGGLSCPQADGVFVAFLLPGSGSLLVATKAFPGGRQLGSLEGDRLRLTPPGLSMMELATDFSLPGSVPVWGMMDRSLEVGSRSGCVSFGEREFTTEDDLKTFLHWVLRDVVFRVRSEHDAEPVAIRLADRTVTLEVSAPGLRPARLSVREAGTVGLRLPDSESIYFFQPVILEEATGRLAVKVLAKEGAFFGEGAAREIAFVIAGREAPGVTPTEPVLEIRCAAIE